jgi:hypothetical protein
MTSIFQALLPHLQSSASVVLRWKAASSFGAIGQLCLDHDILDLAPAVIDAHTELGGVVGDAFRRGGAEGSWGITVLASVIACTSYQLLEHKKWMKTALYCLNAGLNNKREQGVKLASRVLWSMLVYGWADGHRLGLLDFGVDEDHGTIVRQAKFTDDGAIVKSCQAALMNHPVGTVCVGAYVGDGTDQQGVSVGLQIVRVMLEESIAPGIEMLFRLLARFDVTPSGDDDDGSAVNSFSGFDALQETGKPFVWDPRRIVCPSLLDGSLLYSPPSNGQAETDADAKKYQAVAKKTLSEDCIQVIDIRPLDAEEIRAHWDHMMRCWKLVLVRGLAVNDLDSGVSDSSLSFFSTG